MIGPVLGPRRGFQVDAYSLMMRTADSLWEMVRVQPGAVRRLTMRSPPPLASLAPGYTAPRMRVARGR
jgi:hypothetical protein